MNRPESDKTFADLDLGLQEFRRLGHGVIDMIVEGLQNQDREGRFTIYMYGHEGQISFFI